MPDFKCNNEYCRDCHDSYKRKHRCVSGAIYNNTMQLKSADESTSSEFNYNLAEAFMFLSNFVGDIHKYNWPNDVSIWEHCANNHTACPNRYASESISLACKFAYRNATPGSTLEGRDQENLPNEAIIMEIDEAIEAWLTMEMQHIANLEKDIEFLRLALPNPSVSNIWF
ncbi:Endonuclease 4 [Glycine max]|nr:Endonuclease 4 [Glycine max]